nr:hypothetical protein CFP56_36444 [Quercus suber]
MRTVFHADVGSGSETVRLPLASRPTTRITAFAQHVCGDPSPALLSPRLQTTEAALSPVMSDPDPQEVSSDEDTDQRTPLERLYPDPIGPPPPTPYLRPVNLVIPPSQEARARVALFPPSRHAAGPAPERTAERHVRPGQLINLETWRRQCRPRPATHVTRLIRESSADVPAQHQSRHNQVGRGTLAQSQRAHTGHLCGPRVQPISVLGPHFRFPILARLELLRASPPTCLPRPSCESPRKARKIIMFAKPGYRVRKLNGGLMQSAKLRILEARRRFLRARRSPLLTVVLAKEFKALWEKRKGKGKRKPGQKFRAFLESNHAIPPATSQKSIGIFPRLGATASSCDTWDR